jgi:hypothetical protein
VTLQVIALERRSTSGRGQLVHPAATGRGLDVVYIEGLIGNFFLQSQGDLAGTAGRSTISKPSL